MKEVLENQITKSEIKEIANDFAHEILNYPYETQNEIMNLVRDTLLSYRSQTVDEAKSEIKSIEKLNSKL